MRMVYQWRKTYLHEQTELKKKISQYKGQEIMRCFRLTVYSTYQVIKCLKGVVHLKMKALSSFTQPHLLLNFLGNTQREIGVQTTLNPIDFHSMDKRNSPQKKVSHTGLE